MTSGSTLQLDSTRTLKNDLAFVYHGACLNYFESKDYDQAVKYCTRGIELEPNQEYFYSLRSMAYENSRNYFQAINDLTKAIELKPEKVNNFPSFVFKLKALG